MNVELSSGYEVEVHEPQGLSHLFQGILGETIQRLKKMSKPSWQVIHDACICEVFYVAGQLKQQGSSLTLGFLLGEFDTFWDDVAEKMRRG